MGAAVTGMQLSADMEIFMAARQWDRAVMGLFKKQKTDRHHNHSNNHSPD